MIPVAVPVNPQLTRNVSYNLLECNGCLLTAFCIFFSFSVWIVSCEGKPSVVIPNEHQSTSEGVHIDKITSTVSILNIVSTIFLPSQS